MPFDRTQLDALRDTLRRLSDTHGLTSEKLLKEIADDRKAKRLPALLFSRSSLDRIKKGENTRKIPELSYIWDFLNAHPRYRSLFGGSETDEMRLPPDAAMAEALGKFFAETREGNTYHLANVRSLFVGMYTMYRPHWRSTIESMTLIQTSLIKISDATYGLQITEIQDYSKGGVYNYYQKDEGLVFPYGKYVYFVTREMGGRPDQSAVKLGVVDGFLTGGGTAQIFQGVLFGSSNLFIYPAARFFCRRTRIEIKSEIMPVDDVPDREARQYLRSPILRMPHAL